MSRKRKPYLYYEVEELAQRSPVVRKLLERLAPSPATSVRGCVEGTTLHTKLDLTQPLKPQLEQLNALAQNEQRSRGLGLPRSRGPSSDMMKSGMRVLKMLADGKSYQQAGNALWPTDATPAGKKARARRAAEAVAKSHRRARPGHKRLR